MTRKDKRLSRIQNNVRGVSLDDFEALIKEYGYIEESSHAKAIIGCHTLPYKRENPVKSCYVKELLTIIEGLKGT